MTDILESLYSKAAEESLVGAALINPGVLDLIDIQPQHFFIWKHKVVWDALRSLKQRGVSPDMVTVSEELEKGNRLAEIGGVSYLAELVNCTPSSLGAEDYAKIVKDKSSRRRVVQVAEELVRSVSDISSNLDGSISKAMTALTTTADVTKGAVHWSKYLQEANDYIQERNDDPREVWGMITGFKDYDYITGGIQKKEVVLISGQPGIGKSFFVLQLGQNLGSPQGTQPGNPGALYSLEMQGKSIGLRGLSMQTGIATRAMKSGKVKPDEWEGYYQGLEQLLTLPIYLSDGSSWTTTALRADLARLKQLHDIQWFIIDYAYLLADGDGKLNEIEKTQLVMKNLKSIVMDLDLAGIVIHSIVKEGMGQTEVSQKSLRGSGQIIYDADVIMFLTIPDARRPDIIQCTFGKGRELDMKANSFEIMRIPGKVRFADCVSKSRATSDWVK